MLGHVDGRTCALYAEHHVHTLGFKDHASVPLGVKLCIYTSGSLYIYTILQGSYMIIPLNKKQSEVNVFEDKR